MIGRKQDASSLNNFMPKYIDIHSHTNFKAFEEDGDEVIQRALDNGTWVINVGSQYSTSKRAVEIANKYETGVFACVGLHPIHLEEQFHDDEEIGGEGFTTRAEEFDKEAYRELLKDPKVVGIGECGLDYYHLNKDSVEKQKKAFIEQIELANEVNKPLMLHMRNNPTDKSLNVYDDVLEILKKYAKACPEGSGVKGVSHCFSGTAKDMKNFVDLGFYISFSGNVTYKHKAGFPDYEEIIKATPLDKILADTDSPYLAPVPHRGERNEPVYVKEIVKKIAEIKNLEEEIIAKSIVENAKRLFDI
ncbi:TatD family hydrolase [Patescibacteria group bacterium]|nr:TatD family hydrolase [Patescibacteria group bacterium]